MTESQNTLVKGLKKINEISLEIKADTQTLYHDKNGRMIKMEDNERLSKYLDLKKKNHIYINITEVSLTISCR